MEAEGAAGWDASAAAWIDRVDSGDPSRVYLLDPVALELCGDVAGLEILDVGCGEGRFSRKLAERGATIAGIDPCRTFIETASQRHAAGNYVVASAEQIPFPDAVFDLVICYLVLIDVPDFRQAIREVARVLKPGGRLVVVNIPSFRSCAVGSGWSKDTDGNRLHVAVDNYFTERAKHENWCDISITNYHRPAEAYFTAFIAAGLRLTAYREPRASAELVAEQPSFASEERVPFFNLFAWTK